MIPTGVCRYCERALTFILVGEDWDWCDSVGPICPVHASGRHYPVEPVEGIDY